MPDATLNSIKLQCEYRDEWDDGFFAHGWKLIEHLQYEEVIASSSYANEKVKTSVFIHDIVDHYLCGFPPFGHRNEIKAVMQLHLRTGAEIYSSYALMMEDVMKGKITGESAHTFLPLLMSYKLKEVASFEKLLDYFRTQLGVDRLREVLIQHCFAIGYGGIPEAIAQYSRLGLSYCMRGAVAVTLQTLLEEADDIVARENIKEETGIFSISDSVCSVELRTLDIKLLRMVK